MLDLVDKETIERALDYLNGNPMLHTSSERLTLALIELLKGYLETVKKETRHDT